MSARLSYTAYLIVLVDYIDSSGLIEGAGLGEVGVQRCSDDDVVVAVAVDVEDG